MRNAPRSSLLFAVLLLALSGAEGRAWQDDAAIDRAREFQRTARRHGDAWTREFLDVFLGANRAKSQPEISAALDRIAGAKTKAELGKVLGDYAGEARLSPVLNLAVRESKVWAPGKLIGNDTLNGLWSVLYHGPPARGSEFRLEPYPLPKELEAWLFEEQKINDKIMRFPSQAAIGTLPRELDPTRGPIFWLPHLEIPVEEARILDAGKASAATKKHFFIERDGRTYVRYFVHPASLRSPAFQNLVEKYGVKLEYLATPSSSPRSLAAWNPRTGDSFVLAKTSLDAEVGELRRINPLDKGIRAVTTTRALDAYFAEHLGGRAPPFLREPLVVFPPGPQFGMIVREVPPGFPGTLVPGSAIVSSRPGGDPLLVEMIRKSGMPPMEYVSQKFLAPLLRTYGEVTFGAGLVGEPHQQNVLFEVGRDGQLTGRVVLRDLDSYKIDVEHRLRQGLGVRDLFRFPDPGVVGHLKLSKARTYYDASYLEYVREDYGYMLSRGLRKYFPEVTEAKLHAEMDRLYLAEVKRHLGIEVEGPIKPNRIEQLYRTKARALTPEETRVPQSTLRAEFERLEFNRRAQWVASKAAPAPRHRFYLHDGAIEMRDGPKVLGFGLLEPAGAKDFYKDVPYPRREPDARRLKSLYDAAARPIQDRAPSARTFVRSEAVGTLNFAAAYLLKEAFKAVETRDVGQMKAAAGQMKTPEFWGSLAVFTAAAKTTEFGLNRLPLSGVTKGLSRAALPLAAGMAAVQLLSGQASLQSVLISTGSFLAAGLAVNILADSFIYPILFAAGPPGWAAAGIYTVAKLAVTLYLGEKLEGWINGLLSGGGLKALFGGGPPKRDGMKQKIDQITGDE